MVFGTTEDDDGGGLREWHNGAGGLPCVCGIQSFYLFVFVLQADWLTIGTPGIAEVVERNWESEGVVFLLFSTKFEWKTIFSLLAFVQVSRTLEIVVFLLSSKIANTSFCVS